MSSPTALPPVEEQFLISVLTSHLQTGATLVIGPDSRKVENVPFDHYLNCLQLIVSG